MHTYMRTYGVYTVFFAEKSPYIRSYTVCIYGSGQPYILGMGSIHIRLYASGDNSLSMD